MEMKFCIEAEDYDEVIDRLADFRIRLIAASQVPARNAYRITLYINTYKEMMLAVYVSMLFALLKDE